MCIDGPNDTEAKIFNDTLEAPGLQHVNFETHWAGNTLDLIFTEITLQLNIKTFIRRYILDDRAIVSELDIRVQHTNSMTVAFRNLKQMNVEEFQLSLNFSNIANIEDLDWVYNQYENELTRILDQLASEKQKFSLIGRRDHGLIRT